MSERTEKVKIKVDGESFTYVHTDGKEYSFKKWTWGEKNKVTQASMKLLPDGTFYLDPMEFNLNMLLATLKKAPFEVNKASIEGHKDCKLIDLLVKITTEFNLMKPVEIQNL